MMRWFIFSIIFVFCLTSCKTTTQSPCELLSYKLNPKEINTYLNVLTPIMEKNNFVKYENDWAEPNFSIYFKGINDKSKMIYLSDISGDPNLVEVAIYSNDDKECKWLSSEIIKLFQ